MGRPRQFDRELAVKVAMEAIWKNGVHASSTKALAEQMGITRSSLYNAFGSREALMLEALAQYFRHAPDRMLDDLENDSDILAALTCFFQTVCEVRTADPEARGCLAVNCIAEVGNRNDDFGQALSTGFQTGLDHYEFILQQAAARGEIEDKGDLRDKALALKNLLIGINVMSKAVRSKDDLWRAARVTLQGLGLYRQT